MNDFRQPWSTGRGNFHLLGGLWLLLIYLLTPGNAHADTAGMEITLKQPSILMVIACSIQALPGQTIEGDLHDCVTGGDGNPRFGPVGISPVPGGGTVTIDPDGHFIYTAPDTPGSVSIPFNVIDTTVPDPLPGEVAAEIVAPLQANSFVMHIAPGASISGNLNDYVTGGIGNRTFGLAGVAMATSAGGRITISPDGSFTYTAPMTGDADSFPWTVIDESVSDWLESYASITIDAHPGPGLPSPTGTVPHPDPPRPTERATATPGAIPGPLTLPSTGSGNGSGGSGGTMIPVLATVVLLTICGKHLFDFARRIWYTRHSV